MGTNIFRKIRKKDSTALPPDGQITQPNCSTRGAEIPDSTRQCQFDSDGEGVFGRHLIVIEWSNVYFGSNDRCAQFLPPHPKSFFSSPDERCEIHLGRSEISPGCCYADPDNVDWSPWMPSHPPLLTAPP
jgi:hypothetical protein